MLVLFEQMAHAAYGEKSAKISLKDDVIATLLQRQTEGEKGRGGVQLRDRDRERRELKLGDWTIEAGG